MEWVMSHDYVSIENRKKEEVIWQIEKDETVVSSIWHHQLEEE
jgi:hypothetical protein